MELPLIAKQAELKGLQIVGTGDSLNPKWIAHIRENCHEETGGIYKVKNSKTDFLITTEVEDCKRVHHLIIFPSLGSAEDLSEIFARYSEDIKIDGRPHLKLNGEEIVDYVKSVGGMIGPSHAFTPWTAIYKEYNSLTECYGKNVKDVRFLELGLSADTYMADRINELQEITFMTNSDAHSPWPNRLGREFNRILVGELSFDEIRKAITGRDRRGFILNVGLNPREGKYHLTACSRCYLKFKIEDAKAVSWRCPECKGTIKKGVDDRINELASWDKPHHPHNRPKYIHIIPLAEVISLALGIHGTETKKVREKWESLVESLVTEINVLVDADIEDVKAVDPAIGRVIEKFRTGQIEYIAGGGGQYGKPTLKTEKDRYWGYGQKTLGEF